MKAVCPFCGNDNGFVEYDLIPGEARFGRARVTVRDGRTVIEPEWSGETDVDWDGQRPDPDRPGYRCLACGRDFDRFRIV